MASPSSPGQHHPLLGTVLWLLDETNIVVTSASALWFLAAPSAAKVWFLGGAVGSMVVAKVMKRLIRETRPPTHQPSSTTAKLLARARSPNTEPGSSSPSLFAAPARPTYGMPSTHSTTISFYGTSLLVCRLTSDPFTALAGTAFCAAVAWSRVRLGHHSWAQVGAGVALGAGLGVAHWLAWSGFGGWEGVQPVAEGGWALAEHVLERVRAAM